MSLPVIPKKHFDVKSKYLPGGKLTLQPFYVGLENLLLQVKDSEDDQEKMSAIKQVVEGCLVTPNTQAGKIPLFALEELFLRLRQHSVGELIEQQYQCTNVIGAHPTTSELVKCNKVIPVNIDLREFKIIEPEGHTNVVAVTDTIGIKFRYPNLDLFEDANISTEDEIETILTCIESIYEGDNVYDAESHTREELFEFWAQLTLQQKKDVLEKFFNSMPHIHYEMKLKCPGCGHEHHIEFNSVQEVFQ